MTEPSEAAMREDVEGGMTNARFIYIVARIARVAAQYSHELAKGVWNPDFCKAEAGGAIRYFLADLDHSLDQLRSAAPAPPQDSGNR